MPWWVWIIVALGVVLLTSGGTIALVDPVMLVSPHAQVTDAVRVYAGYVATRDLGLAIMLIAGLVLRAKGTLNATMLLIALIQFLDAATDLQEGRFVIVAGVMVIGLLFLLGAAGLSGHPFWRIGAWRLADRTDSRAA